MTVPESFYDVAAAMTIDEIKAISIALGYRFEVSADGREERVIRPDGTVAVIARYSNRQEES